MGLLTSHGAARAKVQQDRHSHWSKDFVEHLRTMHFALVLVALVLIITGIDTQTPRLAKALIQLQQIARIQKNWSSVQTRLYEQALLDAHLKTEWYIPIRIRLPFDIYKEREIGAVIKVPRSRILAREDWKFVENPLPSELSNLSDFEDFWNALHHGVTVALVKPPIEESGCDETMRAQYSDGSFEFIHEIEPWNQKAKIFLVCSLKVNIFEAITGRPLDFALTFNGAEFRGKRSVTLIATTDLPLHEASKELQQKTKALASLSSIHLETTNVKINEIYFQRFYRDWHSGDFGQAFPELNAVSLDLATLEINDAVHSLESQVAAADKNISLLGFNIPVRQVVQWGILILLCVQLYFWLHLHELSSRIEPKAEGWDVAWIGVYRMRIAILVTSISCFILPVVAAAMLAHRLNDARYYHHRTVFAVSCVIVVLSAGLGLLTLWRLRLLRKCLPVEPPPPEPDAV